MEDVRDRRSRDRPDPCRGGQLRRIQGDPARRARRSPLPNAEDFAGELVALANAEGGAVFLGVRDDGFLQGIADDAFQAVEQWAVNVATSNCQADADRGAALQLSAAAA